MPTCQKCKHQWTWKETVKKSFTLDSGMTCPNCNKTQYLTKKSKKKAGLLNLMLPFSMFILAINGASILGVCLLLIIGLLTMIAAYPLMIDVTNEEMTLW
ncbi:TIGR04104 family putative zinc finger protein [Gracilibacillus xinjiangensis]|uniref:TIGR04104 family putative zinc finger protein n=1 Tax=Gracilibacillus xinjiangensis TaxID=1193282 RepID=A0ABV8X0F5_9BACI